MIPIELLSTKTMKASSREKHNPTPRDTQILTVEFYEPVLITQFRSKLTIISNRKILNSNIQLSFTVLSNFKSKRNPTFKKKKLICSLKIT
jgi:hypothetical protein